MINLLPRARTLRCPSHTEEMSTVFPLLEVAHSALTPVWFILIVVMYFAHKRRAAKQNGLVTKSSVEEAQPHHEDGLDS